MKHSRILAAVLAGGLLLAVLPALSLAETSTVIGAVTDVKGNAVPGANVTLIDNNYRTVGIAVADAQGNFRIPDISYNGSVMFKALVSYSAGGTWYNTSPENARWYELSGEVVSLSPNDTRLYGYPLSDQGYVWGVVLDSLKDSRPMESVVYLINDTTTLTVNSSASGSFSFRVAPGDYVIYAINDSAGGKFLSNHTKIVVAPSNDILDSAPIDLFVDQKPVSVDYPAVAAALALGAILILGMWLYLRRWH